MALFEIKENALSEISKTTFAQESIEERGGIQFLLRDQIDILGSDLMVLAEEFGGWEDSNRRIDLLCLDKVANIVVVELKRTTDGGHMELQALRYAAMVSVMTFEDAVKAHEVYLRKRQKEETDAKANIMEFLEWEAPTEDLFAQDVRIILASGDFSKEITTSVLWLNQKGLDVSCIRLRPFKYSEKILLEVSQIVPLPEAADYTTKIKNKELAEKKYKSVSKNKDDEISRFFYSVKESIFKKLDDKDMPNKVSRWAGSDNGFRYYHLWYNDELWDRKCMSYKMWYYTDNSMEDYDTFDLYLYINLDHLAKKGIASEAIEHFKVCLKNFKLEGFDFEEGEESISLSSSVNNDGFSREKIEEIASSVSSLITETRGTVLTVFS